MLKSIPKSSISKRAFKVYKQWEFTEDTFQIVSASEQSGYFDDEVFVSQSGYITHSLYRSIKSKYYNTESFDVFNSFGRYSDSYTFSSERSISDEIYVIAIPQSYYGEEIKPNSLIVESGDVTYSDDGSGNINSNIPQYILSSLDFEEEEIVIIDADNETFTGTIISFDVQSGNMTATFGSSTDTFQVVSIDLNTRLLTVSEVLNYPGLEIDELRFGNIFYDDGLIVFTSEVGPSYTINYRSTKTIYETEVLVSARAGEFNYSQNPSAVTVTLSNSYDFTTTELKNSFPGGTKKIKEVLDISQRQSYSGSYGSTTGSWNDYFEYSSTDPTGSYLAPYITTIGLYNDQNEMVAVAKLPHPIKNLPDHDMNFIVRFDT